MTKNRARLTELGDAIEGYLCNLVEQDGFSIEEVTATANGIVMRAVALTMGREAAIELCHETALALAEAFAPNAHSELGLMHTKGSC